MYRLFCLLVLVCVSFSAFGQQMAVIKKGKILIRYYQGDDIRFQLKGDKQVYHSAILQIRDFEFITLQKDTIKFAEIERLRFKNASMKKYVVSTLIGSAGLLGLHFALKGPFGDKNPQAINGLAYAAGAGPIALVLPLLLNKRQMKLTGFKRLKFINYDSPLYK